jgi:benzoate-CoA ligase family protein
VSEPFNACAYLLDRQVERGFGERDAVSSLGARLTYRELAEQTERAAAGLRAAGLRPEERVMLAAADGPEMLVALLAALRVGAVPVPVSTMYRGAELSVLLRDSRARMLILSPQFAEPARQALEGARDLTTVITLGAEPTPVAAGLDSVTWGQLLGAGSGGDGRPDATDEDSPALWLYTSGTTGSPKAVMHRHANIRHVVEAFGQGVLELGPHDRCYSAAKLFFAYGLGNSCFFPLAAGATAILDPGRPTPDAILRRLVEDQPTVFFASPTTYAALLHDPAVPDGAFHGVRTAVSAGEALPEPLRRSFHQRFAVRLLNGVGSTEALHIYLSDHPGDPDPYAGCMAVPGYRLRLITDEGTEAGAEQPGVLHVSGPSLAAGYWCRTEATRALYQGEWMVTGDVYTRDPHGRYRFLGRRGHMIKAGGIWVSPHEVEARLLGHPAIARAAVVAVPDADGLDKPAACVVPVPGRQIDPDEVIAFCKQGLASFKRPRHVLVLDALPATATGKVRREALRDMAIDLLRPAPRPLEVSS